MKKEGEEEQEEEEEEEEKEEEEPDMTSLPPLITTLTFSENHLIANQHHNLRGGKIASFVLGEMEGVITLR